MDVVGRAGDHDGKVSTGRFNSPPTAVLSSRVCRENGIEHLLTQTRSPTTTGKVEPFYRAIRTEFRTDRVFASLPAAPSRAGPVGGRQLAAGLPRRRGRRPQHRRVGHPEVMQF